MNIKNYLTYILIALSVTISIPAFAQNYVPFTPRFNQDLKGDIVLIGNNILGPDNNAFNDNGVYNHNVNMQYIDIDNDNSTYSSSSADLVIDNPNCYRIIHAGLYWGAVTNGDESITDVKLKGPVGDYVDITGTIIHEAGTNSVDGGNSFSYACYADVTGMVTGLSNNLGTYTMANVSSAEGETGTFDPFNGTGYSAGWSLFIVYEDPTLPGKSITSFDGFSAISVAGGNPELDIPVSGFRTVPAPAPVRANFAFATLEGDKPILGDRMLLNGVPLSATDRPVDNFFNSSVTRLDATPVNNRVPNSTNTLGFDTGVMVVPNPSNSVIANDATSATVRLETSGDTYFQYFFALAVDIIEPNIVLTKIVEDTAGNDIGGQLVDLGDELFYVIGFQNTGNDDATNLIIRDILPINIVFNYPEDIIDLPPGVSVQSYDPVTREIIFAVDNSVVEENDPMLEIRFRVTVVQDCSLLNDACSNLISNQAFSTYQGTLNPTFTISDDPSIATNTGCLLNPGATNFLADIDCDFIEQVILCGASTTLTSGNGYDSYSWSTNPNGNPVIGTGQSITVTETGTYYVENTAEAPCQSTSQTFNVVTFGADVENPVIPYADEVVTCPNDGELLPNIFLCGANDSVYIQTGITDTTSIIWEVLDESSCPAVTEEDCANTDPNCVWNQVETGPNFLADTAGQYRLTLNYEGGCFNQFYFNVYENLLVPNVTSEDIYCDTLGSITVGGVPSGYEFSIDGVNYQTSNTFSIDTAGSYMVYIRQIGVSPNPCIFSVPDVQIRDRDFTGEVIVTQPYCNGGLGSVTVSANDVRPQYYFEITSGGTTVNEVGPIDENTYAFEDLNPGNYTVAVTTDDGCVYTEDIEIIDPPLLTVSVALTTPLTCEDGEITIYPEGGTPPYFYFINSATDFQTIPTYTVTAPGTFDIRVVDSNNCEAEATITVEAFDGPDFTVNVDNIACNGNQNGRIVINVNDANGTSLSYSIDGGVTFQNSRIFNNLPAGTYDVVVQYEIGTDVCTVDPQQVTITESDGLTGTAELASGITCDNNATITVTGVSGGTAPYTYSLDGINFQNSPTFSGLTAGTYTVVIEDASGCSFATASIVVDPLSPPSDLDFSHTALSCPANTTSVTVTVTDGTAPYEYQIVAPAGDATAYQTSNLFDGLVPGTYTFQIRDANNCTYVESYTIPPLPELLLSTVLTKGLDCTATPDAEITGLISGGTAPFTYAVSINGGTYTDLGGTTSPFSYTTPNDGTYQFQVTDANGCIAESSEQVVSALVTVTASATNTDPTCNGDADGTITLEGLTGQAPFTYSIDNGGTFVSTSTFGGLTAGTYNYVVRDALQCETTGSISLINPDPIVASFITNPIQCNSNIPGSIDATIDSGGVAPFTFAIFDNTFTQIGTDVTQTGTTYTFNGLSYGDYFVTIVDANGCEFNSDALRIETPPNINLLSNVTTGSCATGATVEIEVVSGTGPFTYSIFGQPATAFGPTPSTTHTFVNLNHGQTYQFEVVDAGGCSSVIEVTTPTLSAINISALTASDVNCNGDTDGTVDFTVSDYDASVTTLYYEVLDALTNLPITPAVNGTFTGLTGAPASGTLTGLSAGTYKLFVREVDGTLCTTSSPFEIRQPSQPLVSAVSDATNANCNDGAQITITTSGGTGPYEYALGVPGFTPVPSDFNSNNVITIDYALGTNWDIVVQDANGCTVRLNETIDIDPEPEITATVNNTCTATEGDFEVDIALITTGIPPYTYSIDGGAFQTLTAPFTITGLSSGAHSFEIQDANGCGNSVSLTIEATLAIIPEITANASCANDDGQITINSSGGSGTFTYAISPSPAGVLLTGNTFTGVPSGTYVLTITDTLTGCDDTAEILIPESLAPTVTTVPTGVTCFGDNSGAFDLNIQGYSGAYDYDVLDSSNVSVFGVQSANTSTNPITVSGLVSGTYTVNITETEFPFCTATTTVIIDSPLEPLDLVLEESSLVTCDNDGGTITATATGGTAPYEFELTGDATVAYSSTASFDNLSAGSYTVNVRDALGCVVSEAIVLDAPNPITADISATPTTLLCFGDNNATITVSNTAGGQGENYTYTLNIISPVVASSGPQTNPVFTDLGPGTYTVTVEDGLNCSFTTPQVIIDEPDQILASLVLETSPTCTTGSSLTLSASGGTGSYEYSNTASFATVIGSFTTSVTFDVTPGTYNYYVRDANACISMVSNSISVEPLQDLTLTIDAMNATINCTGDNSGFIVAVASGGLGNYVYTLQDSAGNDIADAVQNSPGVFSDLPAGNYQVYVESGDCDDTLAVIPITEPSTSLTADFSVNNVTCNGNEDGIITVTASGGTGIIKYAISPQLDQFFDEPVFDELGPGDYQIVVQDELGCFVILDATVEEPSLVLLTIVPNSLMPEVCAGDMDGEFSIELSGGTLPYSVSLDNPDGPYTTGTDTQTIFDFTNLGGDDHIVYVRDAEGCNTEWNITFPPSVDLAPVLEIEYTCENNQQTNSVTVLVDEDMDPADLDYSMDGGPFQASNVFTNVPAGTGHYVNVRHTNGCERTTELFDIEAYDPVEIRLIEGNINEIIAEGVGGTGIYEYSLNDGPFGTENTFLIYESGDYTVTVMDSNGCTASVTAFFEYIDVCIPNYFTPNGDGVLDGWGPGCAQQYRNLTFDIFDRYGRKIATLNVDQKWDGKYKGKELPTGDYWYVVKLNDSVDDRDFVGHFTLYR
ncbi:T9SS type B sorting domain-containing protein [Winogradskyella maritima]|uniref:T9SS type B sorting domain-containing protein n=1 Tax=Winogradskyella maritima TaxID=1517766 RepID=A0ABV8AKA1_9FLAO|nr:T9SS type B sorting domain-containing protein [Winogradskyella maritima]